uniref:Leucine-rich repeat domain-containing protein n=1 Tax=Prevotella sp. GTC17254 TaxID=3236794 RepID=A0AB33ISX0_9BACT
MNFYRHQLLRIMLLLLLSVYVGGAKGQNADTLIYDRCAQMPVLNYRDEPSKQWLEIFRYTCFSTLPALRMTVHIEFVVEKDGRLTHARVLDSPDKVLADSLVSATMRIQARSVAFDKEGNAIRYRWRMPMNMRLTSPRDYNVYGIVQHVDAASLTVKSLGGITKTFDILAAMNADRMLGRIHKGDKVAVIPEIANGKMCAYKVFGMSGLTGWWDYHEKDEEVNVALSDTHINGGTLNVRLVSKASFPVMAFNGEKVSKQKEWQWHFNNDQLVVVTKSAEGKIDSSAFYIGDIQRGSLLLSRDSDGGRYYRLDKKQSKSYVNPKPTLAESKGLIVFKESKVGQICVANWDTDDDGYLSYREAASVKDIRLAFARSFINHFDEFRYFTAVNRVSHHAFSNCNLRSVVIPEQVDTLRSYTFTNCDSLSSLKVLGKGTVLQGYFARMSDGKGFQIANPQYKKVDNFFVIAHDTCLVGWVGQVPDVVKVPKGITEIAEKGLTCCFSTKVIELPIGLKSIKSAALAYAEHLDSIVIPSTVSLIGDGAFAYCYRLKSIGFQSEIPPVLGENLFNSFEKFTITVPYRGVELYKQRFLGRMSEQYASYIVGK